MLSSNMSVNFQYDYGSYLFTKQNLPIGGCVWCTVNMLSAIIWTSRCGVNATGVIWSRARSSFSMSVAQGRYESILIYKTKKNGF